MTRTLTTNEIFKESMVLSELAFKEKEERLKEYQKWLTKRWIEVEEND